MRVNYTTRNATPLKKKLGKPSSTQLMNVITQFPIDPTVAKVVDIEDVRNYT